MAQRPNDRLTLAEVIGDLTPNHEKEIRIFWRSTVTDAAGHGEWFKMTAENIQILGELGLSMEAKWSPDIRHNLEERNV
jgi:hypothetical protein